MPMSRRTRQGDSIQAILQAAERPLTPTEIHKRVRSRIPNLGLATTYRHVRKLAEKGLLVGVDYPGQPTRFEWADGQQKVHFVCRSCEKLFAIEEHLDFEEPVPPSLPSGFQIKGGEWILYGVCPTCSNQNE